MLNFKIIIAVIISVVLLGCDSRPKDQIGAATYDCDKGIAKACYALGSLYQFGSDPLVMNKMSDTKRLSLAKKFFGKACSEGMRDACKIADSL